MTDLCESLSRSEAATKARRRRSVLRPGTPRPPRRWKASDRTASQVRQGGAWCGACVTAHGWWESRRLSRATKKPASTSTFLAISRGFQVSLFARAQIGWQAAHRADDIGDGLERGGVTPSGLSDAPQALANDVGFGTLTLARFRLDLRYQRPRQSYGESFHRGNVLRDRRPCNTDLVTRMVQRIFVMVSNPLSPPALLTCAFCR